jgi:tetratricopeptide (TPR) repeat protein
MDSEQITKHNQLYERACDLVRDEVQLDGRELSLQLGFFLKRRLNKAIAMFEEVLAINPENWAAIFFMAKVFHRLDDKERAFELMMRAHKGDASVSGFAREAGLIAFQLGRYSQGVELTQAAINLSPNDGSLYSNPGLGYLLAGNADGAVVAFEHADALDPNHPVTPRLLALAIDIQSGNRPAPKSELSISQAIR